MINLIPIFQHGDGAHGGLSDWYQDKEMALLKALKSGKPFDTGWYGSKKEIASARISADSKNCTVEVSVSDDFDTEGYGRAVIKRPKTLRPVRQAIDGVWGLALLNKQDNEDYVGYSIGYRNGKKCGGYKRVNWFETYLVNLGDNEIPGGDNYHQWGWQNESIKIPIKNQRELEKGMLSGEKRVVSGKFIATMWKDEV